jgi:hypothetical protein
MTPQQAQALDEFKRRMNDEVIPAILRVVEERRVLASSSRQRPLKT